MACLGISLLGTISIRLDESLLSGFETDKVRALLAYLAVEAGLHRRSALAGLLWPEHSESAARASLRNALANLRRTIQDQKAQPPYLLIDTETIQFNLDSDHRLDVRDFESAVVLGNVELTDIDPTGCMEHLEKAVQLYQGDFLHGFSLRDSPEFEEWQRLKRESLQQQAAGALTRLAEYFEHQGESAKAFEYARLHAGLTPWAEEAHQRLMRLYAISGQRSQALAQFEVCRRCLDEELGVQPDTETILLYEQIRDGHLRGADEARIQLHNLPAALSSLVGRVDELNEITRKLSEPSCRLLSLIGPGGIGKTRLALEAARQLVGRFHHGAYFIPLTSLTSVDSVVAATSQALGLAFQPKADPQNALLKYLESKELLLVFDNFEHLLEAARLVLDILQAAPLVKILVTTRERLNLHEEHCFPLNGLEYPTENTWEAQKILEFDAVRLYLEGAQRILPAYFPSAQDLKAIQSICQLVQGMPLAILQASSWSAILTTPEIADQLRASCIDFLYTDWRDLPERQRSMPAVFEYSFSLLTEDEKKAFVGLGILPGSFSRQAAEAVAGADQTLLRRLVDKTMLQRAEGGRFELHELLRQFAVRKLAEQPEIERALSQKHVLFFSAALSDLALELQGPHQVEAARALLPDLPNIQAAWKHAAEQRRVDCLAQALDGLCGLFQWYGRYAEGAATCEMAAFHLKNAVSEPPCEAETCLLIRILAWQSYFDTIMGKTVEPEQNLARAFQIVGKLDLNNKTCRLAKAFLLQQAANYFIEKEYSRGQEYGMESLALYRELEWPWRVAEVLELLAWHAPHQEALILHTTWLEESLAIRRTLQDQSGILKNLTLLGILTAQQGKFERSNELLHECRQYDTTLENQSNLFAYLNWLAVWLTWQGRFDEALTTWKEDAAQHARFKDQEGYCLALGMQAWVETNLGDYQQAASTIRASLEIARQIGSLNIQAITLFGLGQNQAVEGQLEQAYQTIQESVSIYRQMPLRDEMGMALLDMAVLEMHFGLAEQARYHLREGASIIAQSGSWQAKVNLATNYSRILAQQGRVERATEFFALATRYPYIENSRFWWDLIGQHIQELKTRIPLEAAQAAEQRGKNRDLDESVQEIINELGLP